MKLISKIYLVISLILFFSQYAQSQEALFRIKGLKSNKALIYSLQGEKTFLSDSVLSKREGEFTYVFNPEKLHPGFYRIAFGERSWIDFLFDNETVSIESNISFLNDSLKILSSESNKIYRRFTRLNRDYKTRTELLQMLLLRYPKEDSFYEKVKERIKELQQEYISFTKGVANIFPGRFISAYVASSRLPVIDYSLTPEAQLLYLKSHALDNVDFSNTRLIYSDALNNRAIEYLTYYRNPQLTKGQLEKEFTAAVDTLLNKARGNQFVYRHITNYLIDGFRKFGFDEVIDYIVSNYVIKDDICLDSKTGVSIQRRIDQNKKLRLNAEAPDLVLPDSSGKTVSFKDAGGRKVLVVFYSSSCPHCQTMLPLISDMYKKQRSKEVEVLAVSMDTDRNEWLSFIRKNKFDWLNVSDLKGWEGKAIEDYYIYATPTMFLLDQSRRILERPLSSEELREVFFK